MKCQACGGKTKVVNCRSIKYDEEGMPDTQGYKMLNDAVDFSDMFSAFKVRKRVCTECGLTKNTVEVDVNELKSATNTARVVYKTIPIDPKVMAVINAFKETKACNKED